MKIKPEHEEPTTPVLNERQRAFAHAYFAGPTRGVGSTSARLAGYVGTDHSLETMASRLLRHVGVRAELARLREEAEDETIADARARQLMLSKMARGTLKVPLGIHNGRVVMGPPKASDRRGAAEQLADLNGEFREAVDLTVTGPAGGPIQVQHIPPAVARAELLARLVAQVGADEAERMVRVLLGEPEPVAMIEAPKEVP